jgi:NADH-quinone oxidoreductase subunit J
MKTSSLRDKEQRSPGLDTTTRAMLATNLPNLFKRSLTNLLTLVPLFLAVAVAFIGLYHTAIYVIAYSLPALFALFIPALTVVLSVGVIFSSNPVNCLLCLITVFFDTVLLYLSVGAEFLALVFLIVYVGAISILFLFVIMLLNVKELAAAPRRIFAFTQVLALFTGAPFLISFVASTSYYLSFFIAGSNLMATEVVSSSTLALTNYSGRTFMDILVFTELLYGYYSYLFIITSLLLLTAMLGAIILATAATDTEVGPLPRSAASLRLLLTNNTVKNPRLRPFFVAQQICLLIPSQTLLQLFPRK